MKSDENKAGSIREAIKSINEAADEFLGECVKMGLMKEKPKITGPVNYDGLEVAAVRHPDLGEFYYDRKYGSIDWRTPEGDEVSLGQAWWKQMAEDLPKILRVLGVDA
jgi:hypothetical protein